MSLSILTLVLGPLENNTYLLADERTGTAAIVDPSFDSDQVLAEANQHGWRIETILLTHAHFDHIAGVGLLFEQLQVKPKIYLHPADLALFQHQGSARDFGITLGNLPSDTLPLTDGQTLEIGSHPFHVRHTPGHTPGHVIFHCPDAGAAFCGDLVFAGSVGRTDLPGGSSLLLMRSIRQHILTLPGETRLLCGHGPETTVSEEVQSNPFF